MEKIKLSENALKVLEARYLSRDQDRHVVETPEQLFQAVSQTVSEISYMSLGGVRTDHPPSRLK